jgi:hypothetical protein
MKFIQRSQAHLHSTFKICAVFAVASVVTLARGEDTSVQGMKAAIEGAYILQELHRNGEVLRPPSVDARVVLLNGRIMFIAPDGARELNKTTVAGYGKYMLEPGKFIYGWEGWTAVTQTAAGTSVSEKLPWEGLRTFAASSEDNEVRLRATNGPSEFRFNEEGLSFTDGKQTWVYRRVTAN